MGNHVKARPRAKPKPKSIKAKINRKMGSKRRTQRMGKELKKGEKGAAASFLTRAQVLRRLQISLRDFRRLCILKGVYPRDPSKKASGKDKTYYHIKDVGFLSHEPVLQSFRDFKTFMRKLRRTIGRKNIKDAQRRELNERPVYKLDHLIKERYPRFLDAVRDLDDALSLVHLFASLPQMRRRTSAHTETCKRLVKEWSFYVSKAKCLSKVFVSIKGVYFQAEVMGQPVTWVAPHMFTTHYPHDVDFSIMLTFLEFHETLLKFAMFKLFHTLDLRYPPVLDAELDGVDAGLATLKPQSLEDVEDGGEGGAGRPDGEEEEEEEHKVLPSTKDERRAAKKKLKEDEKKLKSLEAKLGQISRADKAAAAAAAAGKAEGGVALLEGGEGVDEEDVEMGDALTAPLEEAFMSRTQEGEDILADGGVAGEEERRKVLFRGLKFFFGREVPKAWLEFVVASCGGVVGWEGEGSPFTSSDAGITHQVVDRPTLTEPRRKRREYVQPQWALDSLNARMLLPVARYAPGAALPPHLSPFVDDTAEGYVPAYREELDKLRSAAEARRKRELTPGQAEEDEEENADTGAAGVEDDDDEEEDEDGDAFAQDLERERAGTTFSKAKKNVEQQKQQQEGKLDNARNELPPPPGAAAQPQTGFWTAFANSVAMIIATEIGDKTFFIAAIMAMSYPRMAVFGGAVGALAVMTVLSAALGFALPAILPKTYTHYASALLFLYFGLKMLKEGMDAHGGPSEELTEVEEELTKKNEGEPKKVDEFEMEAGGAGLGNGSRRSNAKKTLSQVLTMSFTMTFLAEWGDRSQIATIALATNKDPFGVTAGGIIGHSMCTGMAVIGGRMLAARISEKTVHLIGGALFLVFGLHALLFGE